MLMGVRSTPVSGGPDEDLKRLTAQLSALSVDQKQLIHRKSGIMRRMSSVREEDECFLSMDHGMNMGDFADHIERPTSSLSLGAQKAKLQRANSLDTHQPRCSLPILVTAKSMQAEDENVFCDTDRLLGNDTTAITISPALEEEYQDAASRRSSDRHYLSSNRRQKTVSSTSTIQEDQTEPAEEWPCRPCGIFLGTCHLMIGGSLVIFDVSTNSISETAFAITASICFIVCGILSLISSRKLDRGSMLLFLIFSITSTVLCVALFVESSIVVNRNCYHYPYEECASHHKINVHAALICFSLMEGTISLISVIVCFRSLRYAYAMKRQGVSPYETLMVGDFKTLEQPTKLLSVPRRNKSNRVTMHYLLKN